MDQEMARHVDEMVVACEEAADLVGREAVDVVRPFCRCLFCAACCGTHVDGESTGGTVEQGQECGQRREKAREL